MKKCTSCGELKPESEFHWRNKLLGKRRGYCKKCQAEKYSRWYENEDKAKIVKERTNERNARMRDESRRYVYDYHCNHAREICGESNPAALHLGLWKDGLDCLLEPWQAVHVGDEDVLNTARLQVSNHA